LSEVAGKDRSAKSPGTAEGEGVRDDGALRHLLASPWISWVGLRYLKSKKNSRFLSFITLLSIAGVALGVMAMIVVLSVMDGFESELKKRLMSSELHVLIQPKSDVPGFSGGFVPAESVDQAVVKAAIERVAPLSGFWPVVATEAIFKHGKRVTGVVVKGVTEERLAKLKGQVTEQAEPQLLVTREEGAEGVRLPGLYVGQELAYEMGVMPGDQISLISPTEMEGPAQSVPRMKRFAVEGIYRSGLPEQELHTVFATDAAVRSFLRKANVFSQWEVSLRDFDSAAEASREARRLLPQFKVQGWMELNAHLFASLRLERIAMFVILAFIVIVASFNIVTTLTLMVLEKKREISILKAMGARNGQVAAIFLAEGGLIGGLGIGIGVALGFLVCIVLRRYEFITLPEIYYDRTLPVTFDLLYYLGVSLSAFLIVLGACLYPSKRAARLNPLDGIRFG
jgi:lipoprotein-releasing system permease protein